MTREPIPLDSGDGAGRSRPRGVSRQRLRPSHGQHARPRAILVLGTSRSGTSAVAGLLNLLGADLPANLTQVQPGDAAPFESAEIRTLHEEILSCIGSSWHDWRALDPEWHRSPLVVPYKRKLVDLLHRDFAYSSLFVIKDPRICRLVPLWLDILTEFDANPAVIVQIRNPTEVAVSLQERDGFALGKSYLLWLRHVLDAEKHTRHVPRAITTYEGLVKDWRLVARAIARKTGITWSRSFAEAQFDIDRFLDSRLRLQHLPSGRLGAPADLVDWATLAHKALVQMSLSGVNRHYRSRLDRISADFAKGAQAFGSAIAAADERISWLEQMLRAGLGTLSESGGKVRPLGDRIGAVWRGLSRIGGGDDHDGNSFSINGAVQTAQIPLESCREDRESDAIPSAGWHNGSFDADSTSAPDACDLDAMRSELEVVRALSERLRDSMARSARSSPKLRAGLGSVTSTLIGLIPGIAINWYLVHNRRSRAQLIRESQLFDADWYRKQYPDIAESRYDPLVHYIRYGAGEGRDPHPLFDSSWYQQNYRDSNSLTFTPLEHFISIGAAKGYDPNPFFHTAWYVAHNPDLTANKTNPLLHYMQHARERGRNPNPYFDSAWYLRDNPDVDASGYNPLVHYILYGISRRRDPHPLFDTEWYLQQYPQVDALGLDALEHYLTIGIFQGCRPGPLVYQEDGRRPRSRRSQNDPERALITEWLQNEPEFSADESGPFSAARRIDVREWQMRLVKPGKAMARFAGEVGVFVHLFYEDLAEEIVSKLLAIPFRFRVYISTTTNEKKAAIERAFRRFGITPVVKVLPNRGWDIAPFLLGFAEEIRSHEICLKLHGKKSRHSADAFGIRWRRHLLSNLVGNSRKIALIINSFLTQPELGIVMAHHWRGIAPRANIVGANYRHVRAILRHAGLSISPDLPIEFPSGSMFWFRSAALAPLLDLGLRWPDFAPCRNRARDATIAHGIERTFLIFAAKAGFKWAFLPRAWPVPARWPGLAALNARLGTNSPGRLELGGVRNGREASR